MRTFSVALLCGVAAISCTPPALGQSWVSFTDQTSTRLVAAPSLGSADQEEKDYAWGDFDQDGDTDLVCVRKTPFSTIGARRDVLFMNEGIAQGHSINGVLVDRTTQFASAADDGGQGMLDLTDDRDVIATDVNMDGWLDLVTATTYGQGFPKSISHPRVYINRGEDAGIWLGFRYEQGRIPALPMAPNFCGVGAGDVTGDKAPDLYFVDYDRVTTTSFEDILLVNDGNGFFTNQSNSVATALKASDFGTAATIADMNGDGWNDIVKSENGPVKTLYNAGNGTFSAMQSTYLGAAYFSSVGDLNGDGKMDIVISDDSTDRYLLNDGNSGGQATFDELTFPNSGNFGSTSRYADLNNDGFVDVVICDVDVDIPGCTRQLKMYRNLGNLPNVTMASQGAGGIPTASLTGSHDCAIFDLDGDGWKDLIIGRCSSMSIWMNVPPSGLTFAYPQGLPGFIPTQTPHIFQVQVSAIGGGSPAPGSGMLHYSINGASLTSVPMSVVSGNLYSATLPALECTDVILFHVSAQKTGAGTFNDPPSAPTIQYTAIGAEGTEISSSDPLEGDVSGWSVSNHPSLTAGAWVRVDPNGTINASAMAAPEDDAGAGADVQAFVTGNGTPGGAANASDVDGGPTYLVSPVIDLAGTDATIEYDRWFYTGTGGDVLTVEVSNNDGASWQFVHSTGATGSAWETASFRVGEFVTPTAQVRVRFSTADSPNNSVTEAGIDNLQVERLVCDPPCTADIAPVGSPNGVVDIDDFTMVILQWGTTDSNADIDDDGDVDIDDYSEVILHWGPC